MRLILIILVILCLPQQFFCQFDTKKKPNSFSAPILNKPKPTVAPSKFVFEPKTSGYSDKFPDPNQSRFKSDFVSEPKRDFVNPNDRVVERLNTEKGSFLGAFSTKSSYVRIVCRDFGEFDGDKVAVYLNDVLVKSEILLEMDFKEVSITLEKGFNKIQFQALNEGYSSPNTAEFKVYDDQGLIITASQWNLFYGERATMNITK